MGVARTVAFGLAAHSGWAALVVLGGGRADWRLVDRRRIELIDDARAPWAKQPHHQANLAKLGKSAGPPWGKDQRDAALAAMIALTASEGPATGRAASRGRP